MAFTSAADSRFLTTLDSWLRTQLEILVLIQYSRAAGAKDFEFFSSFAPLAERIRGLPPETCIIAFREPQLALRGVVDDAFITRCLDTIPNGAEFLVLKLQRSTSGSTSGPDSWFHWAAGESHEEMRDALADSRGIAVAVGRYPPWLDENDNVASAIAPNEDGSITVGVY
jgi:hypothetical protein